MLLHKIYTYVIHILCWKTPYHACSLDRVCVQRYAFTLKTYRLIVHDTNSALKEYPLNASPG
jgi:hypothetical protein